MGRKPIDIDKDELIEKLKEFPTQSDVADFFECSQATISNKIKEFKLSPKITPKTPRISEHEAKSYDYEKMRELLYDLQDNTQKTIGYNEVEIEIDTDRKILLLPTADWHIGARYVLYRQLYETVDDIINIPEAVTVLNGDFCDSYNSFTSPNGASEQAMDISEQNPIAKEFMKKLAPKALGIVGGCHDEWQYLLDGSDMAKAYSKDLLGYNLGHKGLIKLNVGNETYKIFTAHKPWRNSSENPGHGLAKLVEKHTDADIIVTAHVHQPHFEQRVIRKQLRTFMVCGGFKGEGRYGSRKCFPPLYWCTPGALLNPNKHEIVGHINYKKLLRYL